MSQANQVAIAGPSALADPSHVALRNQQQNIPRFLLKLYESVVALVFLPPYIDCGSTGL